MWDYLYSADAARALVSIAERGKHGVKYPLGSGTARPLREYIGAVRDAIDPNLPIGFGAIPYSDHQIMHLCADIAALTTDTGFVPEITFEEGIRRTIANIQTGRQVQ
jgi:nucleoside-diphosphate-sugar epimerase